MNDRLYAGKEATYFDQLRSDVIALIPPSVKGARVLEIGCGRGHTLIALKRMGIAAETVGVELVQLPLEAPETSQIDRYIVGNIETDELDLPASYFDVVLCADVLEHLVDPWRAMQRIRGFLKESGVIVASLPNVREVRTLFNIIVKGDFRYSDDGVLDRTHLRFFCKTNMLQLMGSDGTSIEGVGSDLQFKSNWRARLNRATLGLLEDFLVTQYVIAARKRAPEVASLRNRA